MSNGVRSFRGRGKAPVDSVFAFRRWQGYDDAANGREFHAEYDSWEPREQKSYERGRQQAVLIRANYGMVPKWKRTAKLQTAWAKIPPEIYKPILRETHVATPFWAN